MVERLGIPGDNDHGKRGASGITGYEPTAFSHPMKIHRRNNLLLWVVCMLCLGVQLIAQPSNLEEAKSILVHADILATARVGYTAAISDKGWALNYILRRSSNPRNDFKEIFDSADSVYGKLYAVVGLLEKSETENKAEEALLQALRQQNVKILVQQGDLVDWIFIGDTVDQLYSREARDRMFVIDGDISREGMAKTSGKTFHEMSRAVETEALKVKQRAAKPSESRH